MMVMNKKGETVKLAPDKQSKARTGRDISTGTLDMVAQLGLRIRKVSKTTRLLGAGLAVVGVITLLVSFVVSWASPESVSIGSVDIPGVVLAYFDGPGEGIKGAVNAFEKLGEGLADIAPFLVGAAMVVGLLSAVLTRSFTPMMGAAVVPLALLPFSLIGGGDGSSRISAREDFVQVVQDLDYDRVLALIKLTKELANEPAAAYVLSQVAVAKAATDDKADERLAQDRSWLVALQTWAKKAGEAQKGFEPSGKAMYVVESKLFGEAPSPAAVQYLKGQERLHATWKAVARVFGVVTVGLLVLTLGAGLLLYLMSTRLSRVLGLIAPYTYRRKEGS